MDRKNKSPLVSVSGGESFDFHLQRISFVNNYLSPGEEVVFKRTKLQCSICMYVGT